MADLTPSEREALASVGVDPDAKQTVAPEAPPRISLADMPASWRPVIAHARQDLDPRQIAGFFETPQPDLEDADGAAMTPADWLLTGQDPEAVIALIRHL